MGATVKDRNRKLRQDELRELMSQRGKLSYVYDNIEKIENLSGELDATELRRLEAATNARIKLFDFYMPKLKAVEMTGADGKDLIPEAIKIIYE